MKVSLVLLTNGEIGRKLADEALIITGKSDQPVTVISIRQDRCDDARIGRIQEQLRSADKGAGVLVLTDLFGATPCNCVQQVAKDSSLCTVVSGLNLPMLIRVLNYQDRPLAELARIAAEGGQRGIRVIGA